MISGTTMSTRWPMPSAPTLSCSPASYGVAWAGSIVGRGIVLYRWRERHDSPVVVRRVAVRRHLVAGASARGAVCYRVFLVSDLIILAPKYLYARRLRLEFEADCRRRGEDPAAVRVQLAEIRHDLEQHPPGAPTS